MAPAAAAPSALAPARLAIGAGRPGPRSPRATVLLASLAMCTIVAGCNTRSKPDPYAAGNFVGEWQSTRTNTPILMLDNGEWEIRASDGTMLQYGVWSYHRRRIIWSHKNAGSYLHDTTPLLSYEQGRFVVEEADGTQTTFSRVP